MRIIARNPASFDERHFDDADVFLSWNFKGNQCVLLIYQEISSLLALD